METASWAHRIGALVVDWIASLLVASFFVPVFGADAPSWSGFAVLGVFVLQSGLLIATVGGSFGQLACRLRVVRMDGDPRPPSLLVALVRQVLIALVIPPLIFRPDGRGLHDMMAGTAVVRLAEFRRRAGLG